jgi:hypothetical protein
MLRRHRDNPRQWMTDNGRWFPNISDTAYFLFHPEQPDWRQYITDCAALGITSVRTWAVPSKTANVSNEWDDVCAAPDCSRLRLEKFRTSDERLEWMLDNFPAMYVQIILFPRAARWRQDETAWAKLPAATRTMLMRYMLARFGAYPQIFWLVVNDAHYGPQFPNNNAMAKEVGEYFQRHDPWQHLLSTGPARFEPFPFRDAPWVSYYHIEDEFDLSAERIEQYRADPVHVFLGEDRYEQDRARRDPKLPRYFFRCLFWAWLVAGGSANYGGRWPVIDPYTLTASRPHVNAYGKGPDGKTYTARLSGLDSVAHIRKFLDSRDIDLARFQPDDAALGEVDHAAKLPRPKLTRRGADEYLVYHPNAHSAGIEAAPDAERTPRIRIDLSQTSGSLRVEWLRAEDGAVQSGGTMNAGEIREFTSPWKGHDVVLYLRR